MKPSIGRGTETSLVVHGDAYDVVTRYHRWVALLGGLGYDLLIALNGTSIDGAPVRLRLLVVVGMGEVPRQTRGEFRQRFRGAVSHDCRQRGFDGVVCGHIHHAEITDYDDIRYMNCGDWVESCTALVEDERGVFKLIRGQTR